VYQLTRQVRFAVNSGDDDQLSHRPTNAYGGYPSLTGLGHFFSLDVTLSGEPDPTSQYVCNIKDVDEVVRRRAVPVVQRYVRSAQAEGGAGLLAALYSALNGAWAGSTLSSLRLALSPFLSLQIIAVEFPMVRLSQKFEFSATHRLHNPAISHEENVRTFGKCNNPLGHGHNYEVQVTVAAEPDHSGHVVNVLELERIVADRVIDRLDHKNLNAEVPEFRDTIPSVENITRVIYRWLDGQLPAKLSAVTVWETPKTWCEYSE
jgi:6-pyruvoyltetrahydropterin/6-carboxytetrahydropterin synthase